MLEIKLLNGKRSGQKISLKVDEGVNVPKEYLLEDESIEIKLRLSEYHEKVYIVLHESEVESNYTTEENNKWVYTWYPKRLGHYSFECFFHNYFGIAELQLKLMNNNIVTYIKLSPIEILAKKINAERVNEMLDFLAKHNSDALCAFFRVTRRNAGYKEGDTPVDILIEQLENVVSSIQPLLNIIIKKPITKLTHKEKYIFPSESTNIDDTTLAWISDNTDELYETDNSNSAILEYDDKLFSAQKIRENSLVEDCNVYENQVIHGFVRTLIIATSAIIANFEHPRNTQSNFENNVDGYSSFFSQIKKYHQKLNVNKINKCKEILLQLSLIRKKIDSRVSVTKKVTGIPIFTMKAKHNPNYLIIFNKIASWHRYGKPDWSMQEELFSIKSIPKLFEYYILFYIKEVMDKILKAAPTLPSKSGDIKFKYIYESLEFSLDYEPKYWVVGHQKIDHRNLINSEQWTIYNGKVSKRSNNTIYSNRCPDFVINLKDKGRLLRSYIFDAKYTSDDKVFSHYIPELSLKYLHGLHPIGGDSKVIMGLMIINPSNDNNVRHFHNNMFDIFSENPVQPSIISKSIKPGNELTDNSNFEKLLRRIITLMAVDIERIERIDKPSLKKLHAS